MKVIQINGIRGILTALFIGACLFAGFVIFPGYVAMSLWNKYLTVLAGYPVLNLFQGVLLWAMVFISYSILTKGGFSISFQNGPIALSDKELNRILQHARFYSQMKREAHSRIDRFEKTTIAKPKEEKEEINLK